MIDPIDEFLDEYERQFDYWDASALAARDLLETQLANSGLRAIVTSRAKSIAALRDKLRARNSEKQYSTPQMIQEDIADLAGVRVALYFPGQIKEVEKIIHDLFEVLLVKRFPPPATPSAPEALEALEALEASTSVETPPSPAFQKRFAGYSAWHFRLRIPKKHLRLGQERYSSAAIEIQVASVLMHAWSEVEHDLVYKPSSGTLSPSELAILDQLNGLVLAGEIALEQLQQAGDKRVTSNDTELRSHYELAEFLRTRLADLGTDLNESTMGRVDVLFGYLADQGSVRAADVEPYLNALGQDFDDLPVAARLADLMLSGDQSRYEAYQEAASKSNNNRRMRDSTSSTRQFGSPKASALGEFITEWIVLESLINAQASSTENGIQSIQASIRDLVARDAITPEELKSWDQLRELRNRVVHGKTDGVTPEILRTASRQLRELYSAINARVSPSS